MLENYIKKESHDCIISLCNLVGISSLNRIVFMPSGFKT